MNCDLTDILIHMVCANVQMFINISMLCIVTKFNLEIIFVLNFFFHQVKKKSFELIHFMLL